MPFVSRVVDGKYRSRAEPHVPRNVVVSVMSLHGSGEHDDVARARMASVDLELPGLVRRPSSRLGGRNPRRGGQAVRRPSSHRPARRLLRCGLALLARRLDEPGGDAELLCRVIVLRQSTPGRGEERIAFAPRVLPVVGELGQSGPRSRELRGRSGGRTYSLGTPRWK
jgi:hypothetical protein